MEIVGQRISNKRFLRLLKRFLRAGVLEQSGALSYSERGTSQGSIMSPILANVYLNVVIDQWFIERYASYSDIIVRYADDAVFLFAKQEIAQEFLKELETRVADYGLTLNQEKTRLIDFRKQTHTDENIWKLTTMKLKGHYAYYGFVTNLAKLNHFYHSVKTALFKWLNRRSQRKSFSGNRFQSYLQRFPLPEPPAMSTLKSLGWCPYVWIKSRFEEPGAGNSHAGICEGLTFLLLRKRKVGLLDGNN